MRNTTYITTLRFPLALLIVFIHSYNSVWRGIETGSFPTLPYFCSRILPAFAVPLFFAISGYLFFLNTKNFNFKTYTEKLKRRSFTLLIPYLLWNLLAFGLYALKDLAAQQPLHVPFSFALFWGCHPLGTPHTNAFDWVIGGTLAPVLEPFWFVRDLMLVVLVSPIIYWAIRHLHLASLLLFGAIYYLDLWPNYGGVSTIGLWYFTLGAWFSIKDIDIIRSTRLLSPSSFILMIPIGLFIMCFPDYEASVRIPAQHIYIILGMIVAINVANLWCYISQPKKLFAESSFFVYAAHTIVLLPLSSLLAKVAVRVDSFDQALLFFILPFTATGICLLAYKLLVRFVPRYHYLLTGHKSMKRAKNN